MTSLAPLRLLRPFLLAAALTTGVASTGCGTSIAGVCDYACDCMGCSNNDYDDCVDDFEDIEDEALDEDCGPEFDDWLACVDDEAVCRGDKFELGKACDREFEDLARCAR